MTLLNRTLFLLIFMLSVGLLPMEALALQDAVSGVSEQDTSAQVEKSQSEAVPAVEDPANDILKDLISLDVVIAIILILIAAYLINKLAVRVLDNLSEKASRYRLLIKRLVPAMRVLIWSLAVYIIVAGVLDPPYETVIAVLASVGIAVGFASQDILKNIFGGFMIILDRPFQVGDKVEIGEYYGEVLQIGLRSCRLVTPDDSVVTVPNADVMNKAVSNANSGALDRQVVAEIYLPASIDIEKVKRIAYRAAISSRYVYLKKPVSVIAKNEIHEENFVLKLRVKAYVLDIRFEFPFQSDMTELILSELNRKQMISHSSEYSY